MGMKQFDHRCAPVIAALFLLLMSSLGGCAGGSDDASDDHAVAGDSVEAPSIEVCLVKPTPPGEQPQPMPPGCAATTR